MLIDADAILLPHRLDGPLARMHAAGMSQRDAAESLGMSQRWVCYRLRALGLPPNGYGTAASIAKRSESARLRHRLAAARRARRADSLDLIWPVVDGDPRGDGYALFGALCRAGWAVHGLAGVRVAANAHEVRVRGPAGSAAGLVDSPRSLSLRGRPVELGVPSRMADYPCPPSLRAAMVSVKDATEPGPMRDWCRRRLDDLGIAGRAIVGGRRVVRPRGVAIVGFEVSVFDLRPRSSLALQVAGLGGRGRFGCGVFLPC